MLGWLLLAIGVVGFSCAGWKDLKTTEFEDWLPYSIIIAALAVRGVFSLVLGDFAIITDSILYGLIFLGFGYLLYMLRQWGDGDAWLMGAMGFLFPNATGFAPFFASSMPFPLLVIFNFFMVALVYMIVYSFILGIRKPKVVATFRKNLQIRKKAIVYVFALLLSVTIFTSLYLSSVYPVTISAFTGLFTLPFVAAGILVFLQYARAIENDLFKRKIKMRDLRVGDVLMTDRVRGLTEEEVNKLKKKGGSVWIKEGVRFAPVFVINLLVTLFIGNLMALFIPLI